MKNMFDNDSFIALFDAVRTNVGHQDAVHL